MKLARLLRGSTWRTFHLHRCLECGRRFTDDEPGSWAEMTSPAPGPTTATTSSRAVQQLQLPAPQPRHRVPVKGPYCPACAVRLANELIELLELYRD